MNETELLNKTLDLIDDDGTLKAYNYLLKNKNLLDDISSQVYNFLYCLASSSSKIYEALDWLEEAIIDKQLWYRPEVFEDEDLYGIKEDLRFKSCIKLSEERYKKALKGTRTICTWTHKRSDGIILSLHGNQQNNEINKVSWNNLDGGKYQLEYLQSRELDSFNLFRWEDNGSGSKQLKETMDLLGWNNYEQKILGGFSSACNVILNTVIKSDISCNKIVLQSPWIPIVNENLNILVNEIKRKDIKVLIICGEEDKDCLAQCKKLEAKAIESEIDIKVFYVKRLGHDYPNNFIEIVTNFIK